MADELKTGRVVAVRARVGTVRDWATRTLPWKAWDRMLEIEFVDRSIALAGKAFVSFFPLVIVVAAFVPASVRTSIYTSMTHRLGLAGSALDIAKEAFATSDEVRRATGVLGLLLTFFYANSFTTALQRIYLRAWRRAPGGKAGAYTRGPAWLIAALSVMAILGGLRELVGDGLTFGVFALLMLASSCAFWWFTAWFLLMGQVRWRVLIPSGLITGLATAVYGYSATIWMPATVTNNTDQFGFFGIALALVTWFSGAAICVIVGACAGPVLAEDTGPIGALIRGRRADLLIDGAPPSLPAPTRALRLRDAFRPTDDDAETP